MWAIAASDPYTRAGQARIAAVTLKCPAAVRMEWAARQSRAPPLLRGDIVLDRRTGTQWYLQRRPRTRRPPTARSRLLSGVQCTEISGKHGLYPQIPQIKPCSVAPSPRWRQKQTNRTRLHAPAAAVLRRAPPCAAVHRRFPVFTAVNYMLAPCRPGGSCAGNPGRQCCS